MRLLWATVVIAAALLLTFIASTPLLTVVGDQLVHSDPLERVDAMIVLAPGLDRVMEAANLYREGYAPMVILTREQRDPAEHLLIERGIIESGEARRRRVLEALGVASPAIVVLENFAGSTADEARGFAEWASRRPIRSVMIVTSALHTARSRLTFLHALANLRIRVIVRPSTMGRFKSDTWWQTRDTLRDGVLEWQKLVYYRFIELPRLVAIDSD